MVTGTTTSGVPAGSGCSDNGGGASTRTVQFAAATLPAVNINRSGAASIIKTVPVPATLSRIKLVTYRVLADGTLVRAYYGGSEGGAGSTDQALAYNVVDMQITYIMKDGSETPNPARGVDNLPGTDDDVPANLQNVAQVRVTIMVRSPEADRRTGRPFFVTLSSTFNTRNLGYDAQ